MRRLSLAAFLAAACAPPAAEPIARAPTLAITGVTVVDAAGGSRPATTVLVEGEMGTIAPGMAADLVLLDADPLADIRGTRRISAVVLRGRHLDRAALDALLAGVERAVAAGR